MLHDPLAFDGEALQVFQADLAFVHEDSQAGDGVIQFGAEFGADTYSRRFRALSTDAGLPDLGSIHNVRHTVATALHDNGVEPRKAASLLGHKVTTHLAFYVPTTDSGASEAAAVAGGLFTAAQ